MKDALLEYRWLEDQQPEFHLSLEKEWEADVKKELIISVPVIIFTVEEKNFQGYKGLTAMNWETRTVHVKTK